MSNQKLVHCNNCQWTHFQVDIADVQKWKAEWVKLCATKSEDWLASYGIKDRVPPSANEQYGKCFRCRNSYKDFSDGSTLTSEGHTIQPILDRTEDMPEGE